MLPYFVYPFSPYDRKHIAVPSKVSPIMEQPVVQPMPTPMPVPVPTPLPASVSVPTPQPVPTLMPAPTPQPVSTPMPAPTYVQTSWPYAAMPMMLNMCCKPCTYGMGNMGGMNYMGDMDDMGVSPATQAGDPPPALSDNPPVTSITLFKELTGYPNYGNPSGNADILYTGNRGTWSFDVPAFFFAPGNITAQLRIRAVLDDHYNVPVNRYSARITINGTVVHNGPVPLEHGTPPGSQFNNWRHLVFTIPNFRRSNRVTIENTSGTDPDDWMAFDWMDLSVLPR